MKISIGHYVAKLIIAPSFMLALSAPAAIAAPVDLSERQPSTIAPWLNAPLQMDEEDRFRLSAARMVFAKQFADLRPRIKGRNDLEASLDLIEIADFEAALVAIDDVLSSESELAVAHEIRGVALAYLQRVDEAIAAFERSAALDSAQAGPLTKVGDIYMATNRASQARDVYAQAVAASPENLRAQSRLGVALEAAGQYEAAKEPLRLSLQNTPPKKLTNNKIAYARSLLMTDDAAAAVAVLAPAVDENDGFIANATLGMSYLSAGIYTGAIKTLRPLLEKQDSKGLIAYFLGRAYARQGDTKEAIEAFALSASSAPNPSIPQRDLAAVYLADGQSDKGEEILASLRAGENASVYDSRVLGELHAARGDLAGAETIYASIIEKFPNEPTGYHKLGTIQAAQTRYDEAAATLNSGLAAVGNNAQLLRSLILVQLRNNDVQGAAEKAGILIELPNAPAGSYVLAGSIHERMGDMETAEQHYLKAVSLDDANAAALNNLAYVLSQQGQLGEAKGFAEKARAVDSHNPIIAENLGWILFQLKEFDRAAILLGEAVGAPNSNGRRHYRYGLALMETNDYGAAERSLRAAVDSGSGLSEAELDDAKARLSALEKD